MRDAKGLETMDGFKYLASVPDGEEITGMTIHDNTIYVSTNKHIYKLVDDKRLEEL